jgi:hypothetical protein
MAKINEALELDEKIHMEEGLCNFSRESLENKILKF